MHEPRPTTLSTSRTSPPKRRMNRAREEAEARAVRLLVRNGSNRRRWPPPGCRSRCRHLQPYLLADVEPHRHAPAAPAARLDRVDEQVQQYVLHDLGVGRDDGDGPAAVADQLDVRRARGRRREREDAVDDLAKVDRLGGWRDAAGETQELPGDRPAPITWSRITAALSRIASTVAALGGRPQQSATGRGSLAQVSVVASGVLTSCESRRPGCPARRGARTRRDAPPRARGRDIAPRLDDWPTDPSSA